MNALSPSVPAPTAGWIAIYTKPNEEKVALGNIERQGYQAYCPLIRRSRSHARKLDTVLRPLFPCYVFVKLDERIPQWRPLLSTRGVKSVVRFGERLGRVPECIIEQMRSYSESESDAALEPAAPRFAPGEQVKIVDGPFKDFIARVLSATETDRVWLLLDLMGQSVRAQHAGWALTHCDAPPSD